MHARIQEFSSEGVQISENFDKQKKKKKEKKEEKSTRKKIRRIVEFLSLLQKFGLNRLFQDNYFPYKFYFPIGHGLLYNCKPLSSQNTQRDMVVFDIVNVSRRGFGDPPPENFWLTWCKIVYFETR